MAKSPTIFNLLPTIFLLLLLFLSSLSINVLQVASVVEFLPTGPVEYGEIESSNRNSIKRRELAPFQLCLNCRCCAAGNPKNCSEMPCCFGINCDLPNKPFGLCAFVPKTCNCTDCS